jgi:hypothetical protein
MKRRYQKEKIKKDSSMGHPISRTGRQCKKRQPSPSLPGERGWAPASLFVLCKPRMGEFRRGDGM